MYCRKTFTQTPLLNEHLKCMAERNHQACIQHMTLGPWLPDLTSGESGLVWTGHLILYTCNGSHWPNPRSTFDSLNLRNKNRLQLLFKTQSLITNTIFEITFNLDHWNLIQATDFQKLSASQLTSNCSLTVAVPKLHFAHGENVEFLGCGDFNVAFKMTVWYSMLICNEIRCNVTCVVSVTEQVDSR